MLRTYKASKVQVYSGDKVNNFVALKTVEEVLDENVCSTLCLEYGLENQDMDSWNYNETNNQTCVCTKFQACYDTCDEQELMSLHAIKVLQANQSSAFTVKNYVMLSRILACGK